MQPSLLVALVLFIYPVLSLNKIIKVHHHRHHQKFRDVAIIADNATCPFTGDVLLCQDASYACQDDGAGTQKCLPRDDSFLKSVDNKITMPWAECSYVKASVPSKCLFEFECICMDYMNVDCYCLPSDAWRTGRAKAENCTTSSGIKNSCDAGKYCRTKTNYQECAPAPYLPIATSLYSDCTSDGMCDAGLTCKDYANFAICLDDDGEEKSGSV